MKPSHPGDRWRAGPGAGCWRVHRAGEEPGGWPEGQILKQGKSCPGALPAAKHISDLSALLMPSWTYASLSTCLPTPACMNSLPCRLQSLCPFQVGHLPHPGALPRVSGTPSQRTGLPITCLGWEVDSNHLLCALLCADSSMGGVVMIDSGN